MSDAALHLTERVLPEVPLRHWVCSLPFQLRYLLGYDRELCAAVLSAFVRELSRSYRRRAKQVHGLSSIALAQTGAVTVVQRTDSALRLSVHVHTIAIDGVYVRDAADGGAPRFLPLPEPSAAEAQELAERVAARIDALRDTRRGERVLRKHGRYVDEQEGGDSEREAQPAEQAALHACYEASALGQQLLGPWAGKPVLRLLGAAPPSAAGQERGVVGESRGVNVHASASVHGRDKAQVERLCRYLMRPPLAQERLHELPDGRLQLSLRKAFRDGTTSVVFEPLDFIARLVAAIPPPRAHTLRFHGVLAPNAKLRSLVVPRPPAVPTEPVQLPLFTNDVPPQPAPPAERDPRPPPYKGRHPWAQLMRHVFAVDLTTCAHCQGRMRLRELCTTPEAIARAMAHAGLAPQPPPPSAAARPRRTHPSQLRLALD
jgi:hypothetical protein